MVDFVLGKMATATMAHFSRIFGGVKGCIREYA